MLVSSIQLLSSRQFAKIPLAMFSLQDGARYISPVLKRKGGEKREEEKERKINLPPYYLVPMVDSFVGFCYENKM